MLAVASTQGNFIVYENSTKLYKRDDMVIEDQDGEMTGSSLAATSKLEVPTHSHSKGDSMGSCKT